MGGGGEGHCCRQQRMRFSVHCARASSHTHTHTHTHTCTIMSTGIAGARGSRRQDFALPAQQDDARLRAVLLPQQKVKRLQGCLPQTRTQTPPVAPPRARISPSPSHPRIAPLTHDSVVFIVACLDMVAARRTHHLKRHEKILKTPSLAYQQSTYEATRGQVWTQQIMARRARNDRAEVMCVCAGCECERGCRCGWEIS